MIFNGSRLKVSRISNPRDIYWKNLRFSAEKQKKKLVSTLLILVLITLACLGALSGIEFGRIKADQAYEADKNSTFGKIGAYGLVGLSILVIGIANQLILVAARKKD